MQWTGSLDNHLRHSHVTSVVISSLWTSEEGLKSILDLYFHDSKQHFDVLCKVSQIYA